MRVLAVHDQRERVDAVAVDQDVELHEIARAILDELVIERRVAARHRFQPVEEIHHDFVQRQLVGEHHLAPEVLHVLLRAALLRAQRDHGADVLLRHEDRRLDHRLAHFLDERRVGQARRVLDLDDGAVAHARPGRRRSAPS